MSPIKLSALQWSQLEAGVDLGNGDTHVSVSYIGLEKLRPVIETFGCFDLDQHIFAFSLELH